MRTLDIAQRSIGRMLLRSSTAPNLVVLGDLAWRPWSSLATERAAGLFARLLCADPSRLVSRIAQYALHAPGSWTSAVATQLGLQDAAAFGLVPGSARSVSNRFMQRVLRPRLINADLASWHASLQAASDSGLAVYRAVMNAPHLASVHGHRTSPAQAAAWSRLRSGSSCLGGHRARRHASGASCCSLCSHADGGTWHVLVSCRALCGAMTRTFLEKR